MLRITVDDLGRNKVSKFDPADGMYFTLDEMQGAVDGYIAFVRGDENTVFDASLVMVVNEDGLPKRLTPNPMASALAGQTIVGNVALVCASQIRK